MNRHGIIIAGLLLGAATTIGVAASAGIFSIDRSALSSGGRSVNSNQELHSSIGQPLVGKSSGGVFEVHSGFMTSSESDAAVGRWQHYR